jgi:hypothetical protein
MFSYRNIPNRENLQQKHEPLDNKGTASIKYEGMHKFKLLVGSRYRWAVNRITAVLAALKQSKISTIGKVYCISKSKKKRL